MSRFDEVRNRRNTQSLKWHVSERELPMWVADMDFQAAPEIREALQKRVEHGIFGYPSLPDEWFEAYIGWWKQRHAFVMKQKWLLFCIGIIPAIASVVRHLTAEDERVIVISPTYNHFFNCIENNGREAVESRLICQNGTYEIDWQDLEEKCRDPKNTLLLFCNPQNPTGTIWDKETIARVGEICRENRVIVVSDEIHCDITVPGKDYIPFASVSDSCRENSITCMAPTKTFNIAGIQTAAVCVPDPELRKRVREAFVLDETGEGNVFACDAAIAAYTYGAGWLDELRSYLAKNRETAENYICEKIPEIRVIPAEATYLMWLDCTRVGIPSDKLRILLREKTGLVLSEGGIYRGDGKYFMRMNIACPRATLEDGLVRLEKGIREVLPETQ